MAEAVTDRLDLARAALVGLREGSPFALAAAAELLDDRDVTVAEARVRLAAEVSLLEAAPPAKPAPAQGGGQDFEQQHPRGGKGSQQGGQFVAKGESGPRVAAMQGRLNELGHQAPTHGNFDASTQQAVMAFQKTYGLPQTGVVDRPTLEAMRTPPVPAAQRGAQLGAAMRAQPSKPGDVGDHVATLQDQLATLGFPSADRPGEYGSSTAASVRGVQKANGLAATGHADPQTVALAHRLAASVGPGGGMEERGGGNLAGDAPGTWGLKPAGSGKKRHLAQSGATGKPRANPRANSNRQRAAKGGTALRHADTTEEASHQGGADVPYGGAVPFMAAAVAALGPMRPPGLREAGDTAFAACASCVFFEGGSSGCGRYGNFPVDRGDLCDTWKTLTPNPQDRAVRDQGEVEPEVEEAGFDEAKHPRNHGKFKKVLGAIENATKLQSSGMGKRSSFGGNLHRVTVSEGPGGSSYSFDRRPDGSWHHTHTSGWGGTTMADTIGKVPDSHAKKLEALDASAAKEEIAALEKLPSEAKRLATLKAHVEGGYHSGPSAITPKSAKSFAKGAHVVSSDPRDAGATLRVTNDDGGNVVSVDHPQLGAQGRLRKHLKLDESVSIEEVKSDVYPGLDRSPRANWVENAGGLPSYIERVAKHVHYEGGKPIGRAIQIAVGVVRRWCQGGSASARGGASASHVTAATKAKACAAIAEWEAKKKASKASTAAKKVSEAQLGRVTLEEACADVELALALLEAESRPIPPSVRFCESTLAAVEAAYDDWDRWGEDGLPPVQESFVLFMQDDAFALGEHEVDPQAEPLVVRHGRFWQLRVAGVPVRLIESAGEAQIVEAAASALHVSMRRANPKQVRSRAAGKLRGMKGGLREHVGGLNSADAAVHAVVSGRFAGKGAKPRTLRRDAGPGSFSHPGGASPKEQDEDPSQAVGEDSPAFAGDAGGVGEGLFDEAKHPRGHGGKWTKTGRLMFVDELRKGSVFEHPTVKGKAVVVADTHSISPEYARSGRVVDPGRTHVTSEAGEHIMFAGNDKVAEMVAHEKAAAMKGRRGYISEGLFDELKHPRGRGGKFRDVLAQIAQGSARGLPERPEVLAQRREVDRDRAHAAETRARFDESERAFMRRMGVRRGGMSAPALGGEKKASSVDEAIGSVLGSFPGLKDWHVDNSPAGGYHVRVTMEGGEHHIHVSADGEVSVANADGTPKGDAKPPAGSAHSQFELTGETETPYHMEDGQVYQGKKGGWFRKLEHDAHHKSPTSKSGWTGAMTHVEDLQTGEKKWIAHFPIKDYEFSLAVPKGSAPAKAAPVKPSGDLASLVAPSLAHPPHGASIKHLVSKVPKGGYMALEKQKHGEGYEALAKLDALDAQHLAHLSGDELRKLGDTAEDVNYHGLAAKARSMLKGGHGGSAEVDFSGKNVVVTGKIEGYTRPQVHGLLAAKGATPHSTVGEDTHYLITGEKVGAKKTGDAEKKGVKVVSWEDVKHLLEAGTTGRMRRAFATLADLAESELSPGDEAAGRARLSVLESRMVDGERQLYRAVLGDELALMGAREASVVVGV